MEHGQHTIGTESHHSYHGLSAAFADVGDLKGGICLTIPIPDGYVICKNPKCGRLLATWNKVCSGCETPIRN